MTTSHIDVDVDIDKILAATNEVVRPYSIRWPRIDRGSIVRGSAGASFLLRVERAAARYSVPPHEILMRVGEAGYVGGQEYMITDVALQIVEEQASLAGASS